LALAAGIQHGSTHPLALAVLEAARDAGIEAAAAENITVLAGRGVRAAIDGAQLWLGSRRLMEELGVAADTLDTALAGKSTEGRTLSWLLRERDGERALLGALAFSDAIRESARIVIARLHALGLRTVMVTGDNLGSANRVAKEL